MYLFAIPGLLLFSLCQVDTTEIDGIVFVRQVLEVGEGESNVAFGDVDGDGHQDLVVSNSSEQNFIVFLGDGQGGLTDAGRFPAGESPTEIEAADLTGDGVIDVAVANHETDYLTLLIGDGDGGFEAASNSPLTIDVDPHPHVVRVRDLDGDGLKDLIVDHRNAGALLVLRGLGGGAFETSGRLVAVGGDPYLGFAIGDLNGDGRLDLVTPNPTEAAVLLAGAAPAEYAPVAAVPARSPFGVSLADFDGDGLLDLIAASGQNASLVEVFLGDGEGGFVEAEDSPFEIAAGGKDLAVGDMNGDGLADAAVSSWTSDLLVILGGTDGLRSVRLEGGEHPWGLALVDLNEDGKDDLVVGGGDGSQATLFLSQSP